MMPNNPRDPVRGVCDCAAAVATLPSRRRILGALGIGAAALAADAALPRGLAFAAGRTDALLLNCIDYRLTAATTRYMAARHMAGKYDQLVLAGASLGAKNDKFPAWGTTFWEHVQVAMDLHHIHQIIVIDHRDCGAYTAILGKDLAKDPKEEFAVHAAQMRSLKADINARHPQLAVELLLMALDGKVEPVA
jgi:carbonic anhydrase-like protein